MLTRQRILLALLERAGRPLSPTVFVKLVFLIRHETRLARELSFYDFVPYKFGPFSFTLYRDLNELRRNGFLTPDENRVELSPGMRDGRLPSYGDDLPVRFQSAVSEILSRYGRLKQKDLLRSVYSRYPWYAVNSELPERALAVMPLGHPARLAVYTAGYEGQSVEAFLDTLLRAGIVSLIDVRANPVSRKYGFAGRRLAEICGKLGLQYHGFPQLGIPPAERVGLSNSHSRERLFEHYCRDRLAGRHLDVERLARIMCADPSVLVCVERDPHSCHRSRLAEAVAQVSSLEVIHLWTAAIRGKRS